MAKALKVSEEAYGELSDAKSKAVDMAEREGNRDLKEALVSMGLGAFAGWLIFRAIKDIEEST